MPRRRWAFLAVFVAWTAYVWVTRIANTWGSSTESTSSQVFSTVLSGVMLALAAGGSVVLVRTWRSPLTVAAARFLQVFVGVTVVVWIVRVAQILISDHEVGFKVVHSALGVISVGLAVAVWRTAAPVASRRRSPDRKAARTPASERSLADAGDGGRH